MRFDFTRADWAAAPPRHRTPLAWSAVVWTVVHHPASDGAPLGTDPARIAQALRGWQRYHMAPDNPRTPAREGQDWSDIAYSVGVDQAGRLWELRGLDVREGGTSGWGGRSVSILAIRRNGERASDAMKRGILRVQAEAARRQSRVRHTHHSRLVSTSCPGSDLQAWSNAGFPAPPTPPAPSTPREDSDMQLNELIEFRIEGRNIWDSLRDIRALADDSRTMDADQSRALAALNGQIAGLTDAVGQLAGRQGIDPGQVTQAVQDAVRDALAGATITLGGAR